MTIPGAGRRSSRSRLRRSWSAERLGQLSDLLIIGPPRGHPGVQPGEHRPQPHRARQPGDIGGPERYLRRLLRVPGPHMDGRQVNEKLRRYLRRLVVLWQPCIAGFQLADGKIAVAGITGQVSEGDAALTREPA